MPTLSYGFITDYIAEAFHHLAKQSRYDYVNKHCKFGKSVEGRDEIAVIKTMAAMLKLLHPVGEPTSEELEEYMAYALEGRRRVKEQLNKRKADNEYESINLSFIDSDGNQVVAWCPESKEKVTLKEIDPVYPKSPTTRRASGLMKPPRRGLESKPMNIERPTSNFE